MVCIAYPLTLPILSSGSGSACNHGPASSFCCLLSKSFNAKMGQREWSKWLKFIFSWPWRLAGHSQSVTGMVSPFSAAFLCLCVYMTFLFQCLTLCSNLLSCRDRVIGVWPASLTWPYFTLITSFQVLSETVSFWSTGVKIQHVHFGETEFIPRQSPHPLSCSTLRPRQSPHPLSCSTLHFLLLSSAFHAEHLLIDDFSILTSDINTAPMTSCNYSFSYI